MSTMNCFDIRRRASIASYLFSDAKVFDDKIAMAIDWIWISKFFFVNSAHV